jgi:hypothetical protein
MSAHDWTRVEDGIFHAFHLAWIAELQRRLNSGLLPEGYYALGEQVAGGGNPDVLTLHHPEENGPDPATNGEPAPSGGTALLTAPPRVRLVARADRESYTSRQRSLTIRHTSRHRIVALLEIISAGNKASDYAWQSFLDKILAAVKQGIHLLLIDLDPPTARDPQGVHGSFWGSLTGETYTRPEDSPLTLVAYSAGPVKIAYIEPLAVGQPLPAMPLFLTPDGYIEVPLEATYQAAYAGVPRFYRNVLERATP